MLSCVSLLHLHLQAPEEKGGSFSDLQSTVQSTLYYCIPAFQLEP